MVQQGSRGFTVRRVSRHRARQLSSMAFFADWNDMDDNAVKVMLDRLESIEKGQGAIVRELGVAARRADVHSERVRGVERADGELRDAADTGKFRTDELAVQLADEIRRRDAQIEKWQQAHAALERSEDDRVKERKERQWAQRLFPLVIAAVELLRALSELW